MRYIILAEHVRRRGNRWEPINLGDIIATTREEAERLAREKWPEHRTRINVLDGTPSPLHSTTPRGG